MEKKKLLLTCFGLMALFLCFVQENTQNATQNVKLTQVFVESGRIEKDLFVTNGAFKANDATLGRIDSTDQSKNGFLGSDEFAYVFEGGKIPEKFATLESKILSEKLSTATWVKDVSYKLDKDAHIVENHPIYYVREAGIYQREVTYIDGEKVFKIQNRYVIEDYSNLMDYIYELHTNKNPVNIFTALGISPETHTVSTSRKDLYVDAVSGYINYERSTKTTLNTQDKLIFKPKSVGKTYRLRFVLTSYDEKVIKTFFNTNDLAEANLSSNLRSDLKINKNGIVPTSLRPNWKQYLLESKMPAYLESSIKGYNSGNMNMRKNISPPPPPEF